MASAAPAAGGIAPPDLRLLKRLIKETMHLVGLDAVKDAVALHMDAVADRLLPRGGGVNLAEIWRALSRDPDLAPRAGEVLLLSVLYLQQSRGVAAEVPEDARAAMDAAEAAIPDLPGRLFQLSGLVQLGLPPAPGTPPSPLRAVEAPPRRGKLAGTPLSHKVAAVLVGLCTTAGLTFVLTVAAAEDDDRNRQKAVVDAEQLSPVIPVQLARLSPRTLVVVLKEETFGRRPQEEQLTIGKKLLARLGRRGIEQVYVLSGKGRFNIDPRGKGRVTATEAPPQ